MKAVQIFSLIIGMLLVVSSCVDEMADFQPEDVDKWETYTISDGLGENTGKAFFIDSQGRLWAGSDVGGVSVFEGTSFSNFNTQNGLLSNNVTAIAENESNGEIWFGHDLGISVRESNGEWYYYTSVFGEAFSILSLYFDNNNNVWLGTYEFGLLFFDFIDLTQYWDFGCFECNDVNAIYQTGDGRMWFATDGGLKELAGSSFDLYTVEDGLPGNQVWSIFEDADQRLWVGTVEGSTVAYYENGSFVQISLDNGNLLNGILGIGQGSDGKMWFGSINNGLLSYDGVFTRTHPVVNGITLDGVYDVINDDHGNIWVASFENGLLKFITP